MEFSKTVGRINSIQSMGTLDGPGVRFVAFMQGCPLRCGCCHNPETRDANLGQEYTAKAIADEAAKYKAYFGIKGGITLSGGEPLLQADFVKAVFTLCKENGINTCLDTSGFALNDEVLSALKVCDYVMLDIKYTTEQDYKQYVGCSLSMPIKFLEKLNELGIKTRIRQVIIPSLNDTDQNIQRLYEIIKPYSCVESVELLPFKTICQGKYDELGVKFPFEHIPPADRTKTLKLQEKIDLLLNV